MAGALIGNYPQKTQIPTTQVYKLTHDGKGNYLSHHNRAFISFTFGGKSIEDWNLIATINGDRMEKQGLASFEDLTTSYDVVDGQLYWGTHFTNNSLSLNLATDGITQNELDDFLYWFAPGKNRELILSEHPNRAIMARISEPPELSLLPFEKEIEVMINGMISKTIVALYKGEINLNFIMDEPFWYSKNSLLNDDINIFGIGVNSENTPNQLDFSKDINEGIECGDILKIDYLTGFNDYLKFSVNNNILLVNLSAGAVGPGATIDPNNSSQILFLKGIQGQRTSGQLTFLKEINKFFTFSVNGTTLLIDFSKGSIFSDIWSRTLETIMEDGIPFKQMATMNVFLGDNIFIKNNSINILTDSTKNPFTSSSQFFLYYPGTAPSYPIISFSLTPTISNNYINFPANGYTNIAKPYNIITFECLNTQKFCFTTPSAYTGYNQAIRIFSEVSGVDKTEIRNLIRDGVNHKRARAWAIAVVDSFGNGSFNKAVACQRMRYFLCSSGTSNLLPSSFTFNCKNGKSVGKIGYRTFGSNLVPSGDMINFGTAMQVEENVGDMVKSNYLVLEDRNYLNDSGKIAPYTNTNDKTKSYSHKISLDSGSLSNFYITYKYMYY